MKRSRIGILVTFFALVTIVAGTAQMASTEFTQMGKYKKAPPYKIGYVYHGGGIDYDIQMIQAFKWNAEKKYKSLISNLYVTEAQFDVNKQLADIEDLITKGVDGLIISPVSPSAEVSIIDKLYDKGIPVVVVLGEYDGKKYTAYRATDAKEFGRIGAEWMVKQLTKKNGSAKGNILVLHGTPGAAAEVGRWDRGAKPVFDKYPGIKIVGQGNGQWAYDEAKRVCQTLFAANPKVDGVWSCGGQMSLAAVEVGEARGLKNLIVTGEDYNGFFKYWIKNKDTGFSSISPTYPAWIADTGLEALINVLLGESVQVKVVFPPPTITDDTVAKFVQPDLPDTIWLATAVSDESLKQMYGGK